MHICTSAETMLDDGDRWAVRIQEPWASLIWCRTRWHHGKHLQLRITSHNLFYLYLTIWIAVFFKGSNENDETIYHTKITGILLLFLKKDVLIDPLLNKKVFFFTLCFIYIHIFPTATTCWSDVSHVCQVKLAQTVTKTSLKGGGEGLLLEEHPESHSAHYATHRLSLNLAGPHTTDSSPAAVNSTHRHLWFKPFFKVRNAAERRENGVQRSGVYVWVAESLRYLQFVQPPQEEEVGSVTSRRRSGCQVWERRRSRRSCLPVRA